MCVLRLPAVVHLYLQCIAMIAAEGLLSTMLQHVLFEVTSLCAGELALHASERLLTWMCSHVSLEVTICSAFVFTLLAAQRFFSGMNKHVPSQICSTSERGGAHGATMGFLSSSLWHGLGRKWHLVKKVEWWDGCYQVRPPRVGVLGLLKGSLLCRKMEKVKVKNHISGKKKNNYPPS